MSVRLNQPKVKEHPELRMALFAFLSADFVGRSEFYEYMKSYAEPDEIENFNEKAELMKKKLGLKKVEKGTIEKVSDFLIFHPSYPTFSSCSQIVNHHKVIPH
jgi:hypothetical protein